MKSWKELKWSRLYYNAIRDMVMDTNYLPPWKQWFKAFELTQFNNVKCVILGQDPYPTRGHANGLAFSVNPHVKPFPHSLRNIFKEYQNDLGYSYPVNGNLEPWARNGVLLLNTILTVEEGKPLSHSGLGWEKLTYEVIRCLSEYREHIVFILWGKRAQEYKGAIDETKHLVLEAPHPSPFSANSGFFGSRPFTSTNTYLVANGIEPIDWKLR